MRFAECASSVGRQWNGVSATLYETSGGLVERPAFPVHRISMHLGRPVRAICRVDGLVSQRLQKPGDIDIVPIGYPASWEDDGPTTFLSVSVSQALLKSVARDIGESEDFALYPQLDVRDEKLEGILRALRMELDSPEPYDRVYADGLGVTLAVHLLRRYTKAKGFVESGTLSGVQRKRLLEHIEENLAENLSLAELAAVSGVSLSHFKKVFKRSIGMAPHQYIVGRRVERAMALLLQRRDLDDVAAASGFTDQSHMARWIRRTVGMSPTELRRIG